MAVCLGEDRRGRADFELPITSDPTLLSEQRAISTPNPLREARLKQFQAAQRQKKLTRERSKKDLLLTQLVVALALLLFVALIVISVFLAPSSPSLSAKDTFDREMREAEREKDRREQAARERADQFIRYCSEHPTSNQCR